VKQQQQQQGDKAMEAQVSFETVAFAAFVTLAVIITGKALAVRLAHTLKARLIRERAWMRSMADRHSNGFTR
jgi:heme exporter protein D